MFSLCTGRFPGPWAARGGQVLISDLGQKRCMQIQGWVLKGKVQACCSLSLSGMWVWHRSRCRHVGPSLKYIGLYCSLVEHPSKAPVALMCLPCRGLQFHPSPPLPRKLQPWVYFSVSRLSREMGRSTPIGWIYYRLDFFPAGFSQWEALGEDRRAGGRKKLG